MQTILISFIISTILTPIIIKIAHQRNWLAHPTKNRWHSKPTALFGGIGIFLSIAIPMFWITDLSELFKMLNAQNGVVQQMPHLSAVLLAGMCFVFMLGLLDDFFQIRPHSKLVGQFIAALFVTFAGYRLNWSLSLTLDTMLTIVWIVGMTNAFNLLDNMDGLCAGAGLSSALALAFLYQTHSPEIAMIAFIIAGAMGGFLVYNFNPAKIFMGDCGSLTIGFSLSVLILYYSPRQDANISFAVYVVPVLIFIVPIIDTTLVTVVRILSGRKAYIGGKDHTSHRLVLSGFSERGAVLVLYGIGFISGLAALFVNTHDRFTSPVVIIPILVIVVLLAGYLAQVRVYPENEYCLLKGRRFTPFLENLTHKRQIFLVLLDFCIISFSYYLSYRIRFQGANFSFYFQIFLQSLPPIIAAKFLAFFMTGVYKGMFKQISISDVRTLLNGTVLASMICIVVMTYIYRFEDFSKGIFIIDWFFTTGMVFGTRVSFRIFSDSLQRKNCAVIVFSYMVRGVAVKSFCVK
ncbi:MAG: glycosyl transferase family protein [Candidatus Magnetoglobus multicellularis str. Araruama]|uniref:Glycosyl transferase family protein n=1 Tax=Candidatus Magnetoglobus multicellularis str. Araruama TaxID=890399 RepID=A0A1V1PED2_9BACT|nr:MAG: glycosyl transferase family protein [Candidatus Magnetoglobus multicellularis str. Araruama]